MGGVTKQQKAFGGAREVVGVGRRKRQGELKRIQRLFVAKPLSWSQSAHERQA